jgi:CMP-N-acetylneuraminic acid synthetase
MKNNIVCILPIRKGSKRVVNKNTRKFGMFEVGLSEIKIRQILQSKFITTLLLSTDDENVVDLAHKLFQDSSSSIKLKIDKRPKEFAGDINTDELIKYFATILTDFDNEILLWTHATSPFIDGAMYDDLLTQYKESIFQGYDSLMTVESLQGFIWNEAGPINSDGLTRWPRTQSITPFFHLDSGAFIIDTKLFVEKCDRVGVRPKKIVLVNPHCIDIDEASDFSFAEKIHALYIDENGKLIQ